MKKTLLLFTFLAFFSCFGFAESFEFTGEFKAGYRFLCGADDIWAAKFPSGNGKEMKLNLALKYDFLTISIKNLTNPPQKNPFPTEDARLSTTVEVNFDKITDMGDFKFALNVGNSKMVPSLSSFNDVSTDGYGKMMVNGDYTGQAKFAYRNLKFQLYFSPIKGDEYKIQNTYGEYGGSFQLLLADEAVSVSAAYMNGAKFKLVSVNDKNTESKIRPGVWISDLYSKHGIGFSAKVDIAKLTGMKSKLIFSVYDNMAPNAMFAFSKNDSPVFGLANSAFVNFLGINLQAGKEKISGWAELRLDTWNDINADVISIGDDFYSIPGGNQVIPGFLVNAQYAFTDLLSFGVTGGIENCRMPEDSWKVVGSIVYSIFHLEFGYKSVDEHFHINPYLKVKF